MRSSIALDSPPFRSFPELAEAWREPNAGERLTKLKAAGQLVREQLLSDGPVAAVETCRLVTFPYPALFAFSGFAKTRMPFIMMTNRMQVVQFEEGRRLRTLLFNPTDYDKAREAPFFAKLRKSYGKLAGMADRFFFQRIDTVQVALERLGIKPEDVDYVAFDHLHTQDLRGWLSGEKPFFPNAKLLVQRREYEVFFNIHPMQSPWYIPECCDGITQSRIVFLDGDVSLGKGVAIIYTPGHTFGNMSLACVYGDSAIGVVSENGVGAECYSPNQSRISGVRSWSKFYGQEVVLNGNTREGSLDQYSSMVLEKVVAGPCPTNPEYVDFHPSSELTASMLAPGLAPTFSTPAMQRGSIKKSA